MTSPIRRGRSGQRPLPLRREQPFGGERPLQPLEPGEVVADPEPLDREGAQPEVAALLEQLGAAEHVHALAVPQVEPERVEARPRDRHGQARAVVRVLQGEEDALPRLLAPQLRDLALDPDGRQPREPVARRRG